MSLDAAPAVHRVAGSKRRAPPPPSVADVSPRARRSIKPAGSVVSGQFCAPDVHWKAEKKTSSSLAPGALLVAPLRPLFCRLVGDLPPTHARTFFLCLFPGTPAPFPIRGCASRPLLQRSPATGDSELATMVAPRTSLLLAALVAATLCAGAQASTLKYCTGTAASYNQSNPSSPNTCFLATSLYPRTCQCVINQCPAGSGPDSCNVCNRGARTGGERGGQGTWASGLHPLRRRSRAVAIFACTRCGSIGSAIVGRSQRSEVGCARCSGPSSRATGVL